MSKIKSFFSKIGKGYTILILSNLLLLGAGIALYYFYEGAFVLLATGLGALAIDLAAFYAPKKKGEKEKLEDDFVRYFTYFGIYMDSGYPVYTALKESKRFASPLLSGMVDDLLSQIDEDKSLKPYLDFSSHFGSVAIRQVMLCVYQMVEEGYSGSYVTRFQTLFSSLSSARRREATIREEKRLESLCVFPLVGSAVALAMVALAIVQLIGGYIGGL